MAERLLVSSIQTAIEPLHAEWQKAKGLMQNAVDLTGEQIEGAESALCEAGEIIVAGLARLDLDGISAVSDISAVSNKAHAEIRKARQCAVMAIVSYIGNYRDELEEDVGKQLLNKRFPENKYGWFCRQITDVLQMAEAAEQMAEAAECSNPARDALLVWAESSLSTLCELHRDLRAVAPEMQHEKAEIRRDTLMNKGGLIFGIIGVLIGIIGLILWGFF